jgi:hypothetical protein
LHDKVRDPVTFRKSAIAALSLPVFAAVLLGGCRHTGELDETGGITAVRTACPSVAVPAGTGDITLFDPATSHDATALDLTAVLTNVRSTCTDAGDDILTTLTFSVEGRRLRTDGARDVTLPYFVTVVQGGSAVVAKRLGHVTLHFEAGQPRASVQGTGTVSRAAATLPDDVRKKLLEKRKAGGEDAAVDPLTRPEVRQAVLRATFEALVGFQLTSDQLKYNATR